MTNFRFANNHFEKCLENSAILQCRNDNSKLSWLTVSRLDPLIKSPLELKYGPDRLELKNIYVFDKSSNLGYCTDITYVSKVVFKVKGTNEEIVLSDTDMIKALRYELSQEFKNNSGFKYFDKYYYRFKCKLDEQGSKALKSDKEFSDWINKMTVSDKLNDYYIYSGTLHKYTGNEEYVRIPPIYDIDTRAFLNSNVNKIKLPSTMIRDARFRDKNEITDKKLYTNQSRVYKNKYFEDIIIDDSSAEVVYNNTDNLSTFKQLLMLDTYRDLRTYYSRTLYLDSESMRQVEI